MLSELEKLTLAKDSTGRVAARTLYAGVLGSLRIKMVKCKRVKVEMG